jgi:endonuclease-3
MKVGKNGAVLKTRLKMALRLLEKHQGEKPWPGPSDPLESLILTLLSQNTNDTLRDRAYSQLKGRFPKWEDVVSARQVQVMEAIHIAGLSQQKAARMQMLLRWIRETFGDYSLSQLDSMGDDQTIELLTSQKGVGIKTAAVVLMAAFGRDLCPVDTHVHRISRRLGWVEDGVTAERTFWQLRPHIPEGRGHSLHMNLLQFGRMVCQARKPACADCFMWDECEWEGKGDQV